MIISNAQKGTFSLTIKGFETSQKFCDYTLQYSVLPPSKLEDIDKIVTSIKSLKKSTPFNIEMSLKGDQKSQYFMFFNNAININFKVLTLFTHVGEVIISVMPLPTDK